MINSIAAADESWWDSNLEPGEKEWVRAVDPTFEGKGIPDSLAIELYSDVLEFGPNRDKIEALLKVFRQILMTCDEEEGEVVNELGEWFTDGLYEEDWSDETNPIDVEHENLYHELVSSVPRRATLNILNATSFASNHIITCPQEHEGFDDSYDLKEIMVTALLIAAYDGSLEKDSDAEKARLYWKSKAPEFLSKLL